MDVRPSNNNDIKPDTLSADEDAEAAQRAAIQRQLDDRLRGHREYVTALQGQHAQSSSEAGTVQSESASLSVHNDGVHTTIQRPPQDEHALAANNEQATETMPPPVVLDGQMAEEQQLEPDVRFVPSCSTDCERHHV